MERHKIHQFNLPPTGHSSYIRVLNSIFLGHKEYETVEDEHDCILRTREKYNATVQKHKGPAFIPTVFRNNGERGTFLGLDHRKRKVDPKNPPEEMFVTYTFADDIFANVIIKFSKDYPVGKHKPYLLHEESAKIVCLSQEYSAEDAFEEALSSNPLYYAEDIQVVKRSVYVDPDDSRWRLQEGCMAKYSRVEDNEIQFTVDVSVIYPDNVWSTAYVVCYDCGKVAEVTLCDAVKEAAKSDIWSNIARYNIEQQVSERERFVIRLPMTDSQHTLCSFREGLIGFTPLTSGPGQRALFVRMRLTFYTNEESRIGLVIHNHNWS